MPGNDNINKTPNPTQKNVRYMLVIYVLVEWHVNIVPIEVTALTTTIDDILLATQSSIYTQHIPEYG